MAYIAVPFTAKITRSDTTATVAKQIQNIIDYYHTEGWEYFRMESVETSVAPTKGCFGIGAQPGYRTYFQILIFKK